MLLVDLSCSSLLLCQKVRKALRQNKLNFTSACIRLLITSLEIWHSIVFIVRPYEMHLISGLMASLAFPALAANFFACHIFRNILQTICSNIFSSFVMFLIQKETLFKIYLLLLLLMLLYLQVAKQIKMTSLNWILQPRDMKHNRRQKIGRQQRWLTGNTHIRTRMCASVHKHVCTRYAYCKNYIFFIYPVARGHSKVINMLAK